MLGPTSEPSAAPASTARRGRQRGAGSRAREQLRTATRALTAPPAGTPGEARKHHGRTRPGAAAPGSGSEDSSGSLRPRLVLTNPPWAAAGRSCEGRFGARRPPLLRLRAARRELRCPGAAHSPRRHVRASRGAPRPSAPSGAAPRVPAPALPVRIARRRRRRRTLAPPGGRAAPRARCHGQAESGGQGRRGRRPRRRGGLSAAGRPRRTAPMPAAVLAAWLHPVTGLAQSCAHPHSSHEVQECKRSSEPCRSWDSVIAAPRRCCFSEAPELCKLPSEHTAWTLSHRVFRVGKDL